MFYPQVLTSRWYREDVLRTIPRNIEGMGQWYAYNIQDLKEREAYLSTIKRITHKLVSMDNISSMLEWLDEERADHHITVTNLSAHWGKRFQRRKWEYRLHAVEQAIELVEGIRDRHLTPAEVQLSWN